MANINFLIAGLGNIGDEYRETRHNIGFRIVDTLAAEAGVTFEDKRYGFIAEMPLRGNKLILLKPSGSEGGHNGLRSISQVLGTQQYARLRFGIGNEFPRGGQVDWVLGKFPPEELAVMDERLKLAAEAVKCFCLQGVNLAMTNYNNK